MKFIAKTMMVLLVGSVSGLVLNAADTGASSDAAVLPKITVSGIMTMGGAPEVLFRVTGSDPNSARPYSLAEGSEQNGIKVVAIDQPNQTVTFDNHGAIQKLELQKADLPVYTPPPVSRPTPVTAAFVPSVAPEVVAPTPPTVERNMGTPPPMVENREGNKPGVVVIGSRASAPAFQHFNGLTPLNGDSGVPQPVYARRAMPAKNGITPGPDPVLQPPTPLQQTPTTALDPVPPTTPVASSSPVSTPPVSTPPAAASTSGGGGVITYMAGGQGPVTTIIMPPGATGGGASAYR